MDIITSNLPHLYLTDVSYKEGDFFSRKLSYRIYSQQNEKFEPLFRDFMRQSHVKQIPDNIEQYLTPRAVAYWYLNKGDFLRVVDDSSSPSSIIRRNYMDDNSDGTTALLSLRVDNWKRVEDVELLQRALKNKFNIDSRASIITWMSGLTKAPMSNFLMIEEQHTKKFIDLISSHLPEASREQLYKLTSDKIALDRTSYELSTQKLLAGARNSPYMNSYMMDKEERMEMMV
jgi:hypothetical protein